MKKQQLREAYDSVSLTEQEKDALLGRILSAQSHAPAERKQTMKHWSKKTVYLAAAIAAAILLMGCAVITFSTQELKLDEYSDTHSAWYDSDGELHEATEVTKTVISLQGLKDEPSQQAALEWYEFMQSYDPDNEIYYSVRDTFEVPEEYEAYGVYSQEMVDKLDEIAEKYGLKLSGRKAVAYSYDWELAWEALGLEDPIVSDTENIYDLRTCIFYESGNFSLSTDFQVTDSAFTWEYPMEFTLSYLDKAYLDTSVIRLTNYDSANEWTYTRSDGITVLILLNRDTEQPANDYAYIICNREDAVLVARLGYTYYPDSDDSTCIEMSQQDIEWLAEHINFNIQSQKPDMDTVIPELEKADEEYEASLNADEPYITEDSYNELRLAMNTVTEYYMIDLDGNGVDECFFWDEDQNPQLFTMIDGEAVPVVVPEFKDTGIQGTVKLCEDNTIMTVEEVGSETQTAYEIYCFYKLEQGTSNLGVCDRLLYDYANDCWARSYNGLVSEQALTEEEAQEILNSYTYVDFEHIPISEFPEDA